jgi:hypothetical protein
MARIFKRSLGVIDLPLNTVQRLDLPRNHIFKNLTLRYRGRFLGVAATAGPFPEAPASIIKLVRIIRNGSEVLQSLDGGSLQAISRFNRGTAPVTTLLNVGATTTDFHCDIPIDFASLGLFNPSISLLRAVGTSSLQIEITMGDSSNLMVTPGVTPTISTFGVAGGNSQIEVFSEEIMDLAGDFADKELTIIQRVVTATQTDLAIDLPVGDLYRRIFIKTTSAALDSTLSDVVINRVTVKSDGFFSHYDRMTWDVLKGMNKSQFSLEGPALVAGTAQNVQSGYTVIDFAENGNPSGMIDTRGASSFQLILDVTTGTNTKITAIPETLTPSKVGE